MEKGGSRYYRNPGRRGHYRNPPAPLILMLASTLPIVQHHGQGDDCDTQAANRQQVPSSVLDREFPQMRLCDLVAGENDEELGEGERRGHDRVRRVLHRTVVVALREVEYLRHALSALVHVPEVEHGLRGQMTISGDLVVVSCLRVVRLRAQSIVVIVAQFDSRSRVLLAGGALPRVQRPRQHLRPHLREQRAGLILVQDEGEVGLRLLVAQLGQEQVLHRRLVRPSVLVCRIRLHHLLRPSAPLGDILVELDGRRARPDHAHTGGVHVRQIVEGEHVPVLGRQLEVLEGGLHVAQRSELTIVHDAQVQLAVHPALLGRQREQPECPGIVLSDSSSLQEHDAEACLADLIRLLCALEEEVEGGHVVLRGGSSSVEVHLAQIGVSGRVACFRRRRQVSIGLVEVLLHATAARQEELPETQLRRHVSLIREESVVLEQIGVHRVRGGGSAARRFHLIGEPQSLDGESGGESDRVGHQLSHLLIVAEGLLARGGHAHSRVVPTDHGHLREWVAALGCERVVHECLGLAALGYAQSSGVHESQPEVSVGGAELGESGEQLLRLSDRPTRVVTEQMSEGHDLHGVPVSLPGGIGEQSEGRVASLVSLWASPLEVGQSLQVLLLHFGRKCLVLHFIHELVTGSERRLLPHPVSLAHPREVGVGDAQALEGLPVLLGHFRVLDAGDLLRRRIDARRRREKQQEGRQRRPTGHHDWT
ncbi:hypothetical protein PENTCL1PPCAC_51, partial [Pristionchus entomophagus]